MVVERLKHVSNITVSNVDKKTAEGDHTVRLCNYTDVYYNSRITEDLDFMGATATSQQIRQFGLRSGDILVTKDSETADDIGISALVVRDMPGVVCGYHLAVIRPRLVRIHPAYLYWALASARTREQFAVAATGITRFGLRQDSIGSVQIRVPPLDQQRAIARYLDAETARIDALIGKKRRMIGLLTERHAAYLSTIIFGRDGASDMIHDPILGVVPSSWRRMRLRHCVDITVGVVVNPSSYFVDDGVPFIHGSDVRDGWIDTGNLKYMSTESNDRLSKSRLCAGDVVVVRAGYPGRAAVVPQELDGSNCASILILRQGPTLRPAFLSHFLNCREARTQVALAQYGAAQEQINVSDIVDFLAPVPPLKEQESIIERATKMLTLLDSAGRSIRDQIDLLVEHRQGLITAAVDGQFRVPGVAA